MYSTEEKGRCVNKELRVDTELLYAFNQWKTKLHRPVSENEDYIEGVKY